MRQSILLLTIILFWTTHTSAEQVNDINPELTESVSVTQEPGATSEGVVNDKHAVNEILDYVSQPEPDANQGVQEQVSEADQGEMSNDEKQQDANLDINEEVSKPVIKVEQQPVASSRQTKTTQKQVDNYIKQLVELNRLKFSVIDEGQIDPILKQQEQLIRDLLKLLRQSETAQLISKIDGKRLSFLKSRMTMNKERGNALAVERDRLELEYYDVVKQVSDYLEHLIIASKTYMTIDDVVRSTIDTLTQLKKKSSKNVLPNSVTEGKIYQNLEENYNRYHQTSGAFKDILEYVTINPNLIVKSFWFQRFSLVSMISGINNLDLIRPINYKLAPFDIDIGGILVSLVIFLLIIFGYPFFMRFSSWIIDRVILYQAVDHTELIIRELQRPLKLLVLFFSIDMATYALLYKTKFKSSLDNIEFVVYVALTVWVLFKLLDILFIIQVDKFARRNKELRKELVNLGFQFAKGGVFIVAFSFVLNRFGISITAIVSTLGIGGLAFALAAKDTLSNFFGGITILIDNVFRMGDWVTIGSDEGTVAEIGLRSTTIRTFDNALITIPNSVVSVASVKNWNRRAIGRRIKMYIGVTYESNMDDLRRAIDDIRTMLSEHSEISNPEEKFGSKTVRYKLSSREDTHGIKSTQLVYLDRYSDFSIDIMVYCFSKTVAWSEWLRVKEDVLFKIADILEKNNLEFAYPTEVRINRSEPPTNQGLLLNE